MWSFDVVIRCLTLFVRIDIMPLLQEVLEQPEYEMEVNGTKDGQDQSETSNDEDGSSNVSVV